MTNGKSKGKQGKSKPKVTEVIVEKRAAKKSGGCAKPKRRVAPTQNAFSLHGGYDRKRGWNGEVAYTSDAYDVAAKLGNRGRERLGKRGNQSALGRLGQGANEYGQHNPRKDCVIPFNELLGTINGSAVFAVTAFDLNIGQVGTFPQTSIEAALYERYMFLDLEFYLTPLVTTFNSQGKILMSCDLEGVEEPLPASVAEMENNTIHSDGMPHQTLGFQLAGVTRHLESWFVRTGMYPGGADPRLYDIGKLYIATYGNPAALVGVAMSELRVRGSVKLMDKLSEPGGFSLPHTTSQFASAMVGNIMTYGALTAFNWSTPWATCAPQITASGWAMTAGGLSFTAPLLTAYYRFHFASSYAVGGANLNRINFQIQVNGAAIGGGSYNRIMTTDLGTGLTATPADIYTSTWDVVLPITTGDLVSLWYEINADGTPASALLVCQMSVTTL